MLYESTYNQYFLEHSWGPWKNHMYISRDEKNGRFVYKYPKEYYDKYKSYKKQNLDVAGETRKKADENADYYNSYYNTGVDKVINRSVKAAVKALNFGLDVKDKAEDYLNRFGNAVANAWNSTKSKISSYASAGKSFLKDAGYLASTTAKVVAPRVAASVKNLIKGAGEAIEKGWNDTKKKVNDTADNIKKKVRNTISGVKARASGAELV